MGRAALVFMGLACRSAETPAVVTHPSYDVEQILIEASSALDEDDRDLARTLLTEADAKIGRDFAHDPDRHQLEFSVRELRARLAAPAVVAPQPMPATVAAAVVIDEWDEGSETSAEGEDGRAAVEALLEESEPPVEDPVTSFREGPLKDRRQGMRALGKGKRARGVKKKQRLYERARASLERCAVEGSEMVDRSPKLKRAKFKAGPKRLTAGKVVAQCRSKVRWLDRKLQAPNV